MNAIDNTQQAMMQRMTAMQTEARQPLLGVQPQSDSHNTSFGTIFRAALDGVDRQQQESAELATKIETGASDDLTGAMIASQKASLSFSALTQVRNKLMTAYDEVMKMPL